jgi:hypothetical protein
MKIKANCIWLGESNQRPKEYSIKINSKQSELLIISALAHEMVHVKQWATGEMFDPFRQPDQVKFRNKYYEFKQEGEDYYDTPWEIEAYGREVGLLYKWKKYKGLK